MTKAQNNNCNISDISGFFPDDARTHQKPRDEPPSPSLTLEDTKDSSGVQATINPSSASSSYVQNLQAHTIFTHHELFLSVHNILRIAEAVKQSLRYQIEQTVDNAVQPFMEKIQQLETDNTKLFPIR